MNKFEKIKKREALELLLNPTGTWSYADVMKYFNYSEGKARDIINKLPSPKFYDGLTKRRVRISEVLELVGTSYDEALAIHNLKKITIKEKKNNNDNDI